MLAGGFTQLIVASANPKKSRELHGLLTASQVLSNITVTPRPDDIPDVVEDAPDFLGNARLKAHAIMTATNQAALADDSGLVVPALGGEPGVRSARYCVEPASDNFWQATQPQLVSWPSREEYVASIGHDSVNIDRLMWELDALGHVHPSERAASFVTTIVVQFPDWLIDQGLPRELITTGEVVGHIANERRGAAGFGYDPVFIPDLDSPLLDTGDTHEHVDISDFAGRTFAEIAPELKAAVSHRGRALRTLMQELESILAAL